MRRDWRRRLPIVVLLFPMAAGAQTSPSVFVMVQSKQDKAADQKYGSESHLALEPLLESALFKEMKEKYPCIHYLDMSAAKIMMSVDKQRQLLGAGDDSRLAQIGAATGARYLVGVLVEGRGDQVYLNGVVLDTKTVAALSRQNTVTGGGNAAAGAIQQFAKNLVVGIGRGPQCPGGWKGTVMVEFFQKWQGDRKGTSEDGMGKLTCLVLGVGSDARCSYESSDELRGKDVSLVTKKVASETPAYVSVSLNGDKLGLGFGVIQVTVIRTGSIAIAPATETLSFGNYVVPASSDPNRQSGVWEDPKNTEHMKNTVTWSLSRQ